MALRNLLYYPDARLRNKAMPVVVVDADIQRLVDDMLETMYHDNGVGLAAIQINVAKRVIVVDVSENGTEPRCLINPEIVNQEGAARIAEGCLSVPGIYEPVERPTKLRVKALDRQGQPFEIEAEGLLAKCIHHEMEHLDGLLFIDHLSPLKQKMIREKAEKHKKKLEKARLRNL